MTKEYLKRVLRRVLVRADVMFALQIYTLAYLHGMLGIAGKRVAPGATSLK